MIKYEASILNMHTQAQVKLERQNSEGPGVCAMGLRYLPMGKQQAWSDVCLWNRNLNLGFSVSKVGFAMVSASQ